MLSTIKRAALMTKRVLLQLKGDHRFVAGSVIIPTVIIYFIKVAFDALANPGFSPKIYVLPYGAFIIHMITFILTAIVVVRERTGGTLSRMFVSGYYQFEIILGYVFAYSLLATIQSLVILLEINWLFELEYGFEKLASLYLVMWLLSVISVVLGMLVSNFARNEGQVFPFIPLVILSVILSGIIIPIDLLPEWSQILSYGSPLYYTNELVQELIRDNRLGDNLDMIFYLILYGVIAVSLAVLTLREKD